MNRSDRPVRWITLGGLALIFLFASHRLSGHAPQSEQAPAAQFSALRAMTVLRRILGDEQLPHPVGSPTNEAVRTRLIAELESLGLEPEQQSVVVKGIPVVNVLARLTDPSITGRPLLLDTHYDSAPRAPGAGDSGSGVVALLETARALLHAPDRHQHPIHLLFTDGEEAGLLGAQGFVREHTLGNQQPMVLNFDARGTSGASLMYETPSNNLQLVQQVVRHLPRPVITSSAFVAVYRRMPNGSDFTIFLQRGCSGLNFAFIGDVRNYHQPTDRMETLDLRSLQHHGDNALAMARSLSTLEWNSLDADQDAVFGDILGMFILAYPQSWALSLSVIPLVLIGCRGGRRWIDPVFWRQGMRSLVAMFGSVLTLLALGIAVAFAFRTLTIAVPWDQYSVACFAAYWAVAITISHTIASRLLACMSDEDIGLWCWFWYAMGGVIMAWAVPGASLYFLWPATASGICGLLPLRAPLRNAAAVFAAGVILIPTMMLLDTAIRALAPQVLLPLHGLALIPLYPLFVQGSPRAQQRRAA
jgi:hypothetical protein